jgi:hypothetical protein
MNAVGAPVLPVRHASVMVQFQNCAANRFMPFRVCIENREARLAGEPLSQILKRLGKYFSSDISYTPDNPER